MAVSQVSLNTSFLQSHLTTRMLAHILCVVDSASNSFLHMPCLRDLIFFFFFFKQQQQKPSKIILSFRKPSIVLGLNLTFCLCCTIPVLNLHTNYDCLFTTHSAHPFSQYLSISLSQIHTQTHTIDMIPLMKVIGK